MEKNKRLELRKMTAAALLTGISIILTRYASFIALAGQSLRIGLGSVPIIFSGLLLGPFYGAAVGLISDILGVFINLQGAFHLGFTLTSCLTGLLPGIISMAAGYKPRVKHIVYSWLAVFLICDTALQTLWLSGLQSLPYLTVLMTRLTLLPLTKGIQLFILIGLYPLMINLPIYKDMVRQAQNG